MKKVINYWDSYMEKYNRNYIFLGLLILNVIFLETKLDIWYQSHSYLQFPSIELFVTSNMKLLFYTIIQFLVYETILFIYKKMK
jgi:hypothetical protein